MSLSNKSGWVTKPSPGTTVNWGNPITRNLKRAFLFNEGSGAFVYDVTRRWPGTRVGAATWRGSPHGFAVDLDGTNDVVNIGQDGLDQMNAFSIAIWVQSDTVTGARVLVDKSFEGTGGGAGGFGWVFRQNGSTIQFIRSYDDVLGSRVSASGFAVIGQWALYGMAWDGGTLSTGCKLFKNGVEVSYGSGTDSSTGNKDDDSSWDVGIGMCVNDSNGDFDGRIDGMFLWDRQLNPTEMKSLYTDPYGMFVRPTWQFYPQAQNNYPGYYSDIGWF